jgi:hypothetical protein
MGVIHTLHCLIHETNILKHTKIEYKKKMGNVTKQLILQSTMGRKACELTNYAVAASNDPAVTERETGWQEETRAEWARGED